MIRDRHGSEFPTILAALKVILRYYGGMTGNGRGNVLDSDLPNLLADLAAIVNSASGASLAARACGGERADAVIAAAEGSLV